MCFEVSYEMPGYAPRVYGYALTEKESKNLALRCMAEHPHASVSWEAV